MQTGDTWTGSLPDRRSVVVNGRHVFTIHFVERNNLSGPSHQVDGVPDRSVIDHYQTALADSWNQLTSPTGGWTGWMTDGAGSSEPRDVMLFDLGPNHLGVAMDAIGRPSYLGLNSRTLDLPNVAQRKRRAVATHELVHLLQFETSTYRYWPETGGRAGEERDPNWWLHEATALALEAQLSPGPSICAPLLWSWATSPQRSLDSDVGGTLAAPFLLYLARRFGIDLLASIYQATQDDVPDMRGLGLLSHAMQKRGLVLASAVGNDCFASGYCVDAVFVGDGNTVLPTEWRGIIGPRALTDRFTRYPVNAAATDRPIDHIACRYFEFIPTESSGRLHIEVRIDRPADGSVLRGELITVGDNGDRQQTTLSNTTRGTISGSVDFNRHHVARVVLVLANCAFDSGFAAHDGMRFGLTARTE